MYLLINFHSNNELHSSNDQFSSSIKKSFASKNEIELIQIKMTTLFGKKLQYSHCIHKRNVFDKLLKHLVTYDQQHFSPKHLH